MGEKEIIAICHSGGEFQTDNDGALLYQGGEAYVLDVNEDTLLTEFVKDVADTCGCSVDGMLIKYFIPGNKKTLITISKDRDLKRMVKFFNDSDQVDVYVMFESVAVVAKGSSKLPARRLRKKPASKAAAVATVSTSQTIDPPDMAITTEPDPLDTVINETSEMSPGSSISNEKHPKVATQWENKITGVGQRFSSIPEFRDAVHKYSIAHGFTYKFKRSDLKRMTVKCKVKGCPWHIYASKLTDTLLIIKRMDSSHTCQGAALKRGGYGSKVWLGNIIKEKLKASPNYKTKDIVSDIKQEYGIQWNYSQAYRAKVIAKEQILGSYKEAYSQLPFFCEKIIETNPGSVATFTTKEDSSFHRLFVSFHASILGFQLGCRPLLFLDSTPINSKFQGMLLSATAADGDDGVFPVAFAVVDEENEKNWCWFLMELKSAVATSQKITFVADSQRGLRESLIKVFNGECYHGYCLHYLIEKLNEDFKGQFTHEVRRLMVEDLYAAAYAPKVETFQQSAENIKAISPEAYKWLISSEPENWAIAFFQGARYNHMTSNFGETFYSWVSDENELPITQVIDMLRGKMMELIYNRRVDSSQWETRLTPTMEEKLKSEVFKVHSFRVLLTQGSTFEVRSESVDIVNIDYWTCTCKRWQLTGLPCCHAVAVFKWTGMDPYDYCSTYFTAESFRKTYAETIYPVPSTEMPPKSNLSELPTVTPPPTKRTSSRPKKKQAKPVEEIKRQMRCTNCQMLGHNKRKCMDNSEVE